MTTKFYISEITAGHHKDTEDELSLTQQGGVRDAIPPGQPLGVDDTGRNIFCTKTSQAIGQVSLNKSFYYQNDM